MLRGDCGSGRGHGDHSAGDYSKGEMPVPVCLRLMVTARGARFHLPEALDDEARVAGCRLARAEIVEYMRTHARAYG